jgi:predicted helicase
MQLSIVYWKRLFNNWSGNKRCIVDLVKLIVRVSLETIKIVNSLPTLNERN